MQIATRSGVPPSVIESTWSIDELESAIALARLECWGQTERMVARLSSAMHNAAILNATMIKPELTKTGNQEKLFTTEKSFLPKTIKKKAQKRVKTKLSKEAKIKRAVAQQFKTLAMLSGH